MDEQKHKKMVSGIWGKLLSVVAIPFIIYYCTTKPQKEKEKEIIKNIEGKPPFTPFDPFKKERQEWIDGLPTQLDTVYFA